MRGTDLLNKITKIRREQARTVRHILQKDENLGQRLCWCGTWLHLREWLDHDGKTTLVNANFCRKFYLCRTCASRRSLKFVDNYRKKVAAVLTAEPALIPAMVTFTVRNGPDLAERVEHLKESWASMIAAQRKGASDSGRHARVQWNHVAGSIRCLEVKRGEGGWHPHLHVYALLHSYIDQRQLSAEWLRWTGDSQIVDVRKCYGEAEASLFEVIKYAVKFADMSDDDLWEAHQVLSGGRGIDPTGCLRGVKCGDILSDSEEGLTGPTIDYIARWLAMEQKYAVEVIKAEPVNLVHNG